MMNIPWDQPATLIDLDGKVPLIGKVRECVLHYTLFEPETKAQARILLTRPVFRHYPTKRTWLLEPREIEMLVARMDAERQQLN